jgi:hypothetical protein
MRTLLTSNGKKIEIYDGLFSFKERENFYSYVTNSLYRTSGADTYRLEHKGHFSLYCGLSFQDVTDMGLLKHPEVKKVLNTRPLGAYKQARFNLSTLNDSNHFHIDTGALTLLYYPNPEWRIEWGGYTLFANDDTTEIEHCVAYVPGRLIIFDGSIPHNISAPTNLAPTYRFSFAIQYEGENNELT